LIEFWSPHPHVDDAYISYRYSLNLVAGHGLVYNVGEFVEGFTNLLWVLLVSIGVLLGEKAALVGHFLGLASGVALLLLAYAYARQGLPSGSRAWAGLAPWLLFCSAPFAVWSTSGLETPLFAAAVTGALLCEARRKLGLATLALLIATATRPEGALLAGVVFAAALRHPEERRRVLVAAAIYGLCLVGLTGFRLAYFGEPLPNTFYAKVGGVPFSFASSYVAAFMLQFVAPLTLAATLGVRREPALRPGACWVGVLAVYVWSVGGDAFQDARFFVPALVPLIALALSGTVRAALPGSDQGEASVRAAIASLPLAFAWCLGGPVTGTLALVALVPLGWLFRAQSRKRWTGVAATICLAAATLVAPGSLGLEPVSRLHSPVSAVLHSTRSRSVEGSHAFWRLVFTNSTQLARVLKQQEPPVQSVAAVGIGALGYKLPVRIVDLVGLVDAKIARTRLVPGKAALLRPGHQRGAPEYVLESRPEYLLIPRERERALLPAVRALQAHPALNRLYVWDEKVAGYRLRSLP
jgi:hypothetical protein